MCQIKLRTSLFPLIFPFGHRIFESSGESSAAYAVILRESDFIAVIVSNWGHVTLSCEIMFSF